MIEPYNLENSNLNLFTNNLMEKSFFFLLILTTIWIFVVLIILFIGGKIKSEKVIRFGIKNIIFSFVLEFIILLIPFLIGVFK